MHHATVINPITPPSLDFSPLSQRGARLAALLQQESAVLVRVLRVQG